MSGIYKNDLGNSELAVIAQAADFLMTSPHDIEDVYRVTPMQEGLWTASMHNPGAYVYELAFEGKGNAADKFKAAWQEVVRSTPMLRSFLLVLGPTNELFQVVVRAGSPNAGHICSLSENAAMGTHPSSRHSNGLARFCFSSPLSTCSKTFEARLRIHHALFDGWAMRLVLDRLREAYQGNVVAVPPNFQQVIKYVHDQNAASDENGASEFWRSRMADCRPTDIVDRITGMNAMTDSTATFTSQRNIQSNVGMFTLSALAHAAWAMLAGAYAATDDVLFVTSLSGRDIPVEGVLNVAGPTMAAVPCRVRVRNEQLVTQFLAKVAQDLHFATAHQHVGLARICQEYGAIQSSQLQSLLVCQPSYLDVVGLQSGDSDVVDPDWRVIEHVDYIHPYALVIECWLPRGVGSMRLTAHYDSRLLSLSQTHILLEQFSDLIFKLHDCGNDASTSKLLVGDICLASSGDLQALRQLNADSSAPVDCCIHDLISETLNDHASSIAVDAWDEKFTYRHIAELSDELCQSLIRLGVGPENTVLVFFPKSAWFVIAILAVLKAGGAFVALEPALPDGRIKEIARLSGSKLAISHTSLMGRLENVIGPQYTILRLSQAAHTFVEFQVPQSSSHVHAVASPSTLAYIMFTSGTTGVPKGVAVEHRAVCSSITARSGPDAMNMTSSSRVLQFSSYCFDAFIDEIFMTLTRGACICIPHTDELRSSLSNAFSRYQVTWSFLTPSVARLLDPKRTSCLQTLSLGGEVVMPADIKQWQGHVPQLRSVYGTTECCVICVVGDYFLDSRSTTGASLLGTPRGCLAWIVDPSNPSHLRPLGAAGELLIEGPILARAYWGESAMTAAAWISDPKWPNGLGLGRRLYRTGDLVRMQPDGSLFYIGRINEDSQEKLRGQRFELTEVEQHVRNALPSVQQVIAVTFTPFSTGLHDSSSSENKRLAVLLAGHNRYISPLQVHKVLEMEDVPWEHILPEQLRDELFAVQHVLQAVLPSYMVPTHWVPLQEMPLTMSGKADRNRMTSFLQSLSREQLCFLWLERPSTTLKAASNFNEKQLVKLWSTVLGIDEEQISVDRDFILMGGDSIKAMRLAALSRSQGIVGVSTAAILQSRTIENLAKEVDVADIETSDIHLGDVLPSPFSLLPSAGPSTAAAVLGAAKACQVAPSEVQDLYPMTAFQKGIFTVGLNHNDAYRGLFVYQLQQDVDLERLQDAWCALVEKTPITRTRLYQTSTGFFQAVVKEVVPCSMVSTDLDEHLSKQREASRAMTFGHSLYRASIVQDARQSQLQTYFVLNAHHAVYDAWSVSALIRQLKKLYHHLKDNSCTYDSRNPYVRFVDHVLGLDTDRHHAFWREYLAGSPFAAFPDLKIAQSHFEPTTNVSIEHAIPFRNSRVRTSVALYSAWSQLAAIYGGTDDVVFGVVSTGRDNSTFPYSCDIMGPMIAAFPLRVRVPSGQDTPVSALFDAVENAMAVATPYEHCGMNEIRKASADADAACGFHSLLVMQASAEAMGLDQGIDDLVVSERDAGANIHPYPLVLEATPRKDQCDITIVAHYDSTLFDETTIKRLLDQLGHLVQEMVRLGESGGALGQIDLLNPDDKAHIWDWNSDPTTIQPVERCVHDIISERALLHPDATAVCAWDRSLTYDELDRLSSALAGRLAGLGVRTTQFVPICHEKSAWFVVAQVAVLKAGAACVSLDPSYPTARNGEIVAQCKARVVIVSRKTKNLFRDTSLALVVAEPHSQLLHTPPLSPTSPSALASASSAAYCVFTSGSTGKPKGIIIEHASLCTSARQYGAAMHLDSSSRVLQFASCAFDVSLGETLTTLMHGGCVCVAEENERLADLAGCINRFQVNWLYLTSSVASMLRPEDVPGLKTLVVGGEAVHQKVVKIWAESGVVLINAYGPAETTIYCSARTVPTIDTDSRDIGTPLGCRMWIGCSPQEDDSKLRLAPLGVTGEIFIDGPIVARGYLSLPDLNAKQFLAVPWLSSDRRVYRTGDLAFQDAQGHFHFRGRRDDEQVKINGQRVCLDDINTILTMTRDDIHQVAAVAFQGDAAEDSPRQPVVKIAAFVVFADTASSLGSANMPAQVPITADLRDRMMDVRKHLQGLLPKHMIPFVFLPMTGLPKTRTLKTDRQALKKILTTLTKADLQALTLSHESERLGDPVYQAPRNAMELTLLQHWVKALGLSDTSAHAGIYDHFFDLGGDSISAMHFVWLARGDGLHLSVADVHARPSVSELAEFLTARGPKEVHKDEASDIPLPYSLVSADERYAVLNEMRDLGIDAGEVEDVYPATATQIGLLLETEQRKDTWVSKDIFDFSADLDIERLRAAWESLVERNPIFRTRIVHVAAVGSVNQFYQVVLRHGDASAVWDGGSWEAEFGFGHPLSVHRLRDNQFEWIRHHSLYDGWSTRLLLHQLEYFYRNGYPTMQMVLPPSYYARMLQRHDAEATRSFWQTEFSHVGEDALKTCAFPRTLSSPFLGDELSSPVGRPSAAGSATTRPLLSLPSVKSLPDTTVARLPVMIEAAWALTLSAYVGSEDVMFGVVRSGRTSDPNLACVVCPTASIVPRRYQICDEKEVCVFMQETSRKVEAATQHEHAGLGLLQELLHRQNLGTLNNLVVVQTEDLVSGTSEAGGQSDLEAIGLKPAMSSESDADGQNAASPFPFGLVLECILLKAQESQNTQLRMLAYFDQNQISEETLQRLLSHFEFILTQLTEAQSGALLGSIGIWNSALLRDQMPFIHAAPPPPAIETCVQDLIAQHWRRDSPQLQAPAVYMAQKDQTFTYGDLDTLSARLCHRLLRDGRLNKQESPFVAVCLEKSPWTVVAMLAIWRAGRAVILLDATQPRSLVLNILKKANVGLILVTPETRDILQDHPGTMTLDPSHTYTPDADEDPVLTSTSLSKGEDPCYCIFTSGSTGEPKGVVVQHSAIVTSAVHHGRATGLSTTSRVLQFSSYSFDVAVDEIVTTLIHGGCVCVPSEVDTKARLADAISELNCNVALLTPGVLDTLDPAAVPSLKTVVVGGSSLGSSLRETWQDRVRLLVAYGPSECSVTASIDTDIRNKPLNSIGKPIGCRAWVLETMESNDGDVSRQTRLTPFGSVGELAIEGPILAQGYLGEEGLTSERFTMASNVAGKFCESTGCSPHTRLYRTGDLVKQGWDGSLLFLGRHDNQVKVRGMRVELEAVEHEILRCPVISGSVRNVVVTLPRKGHLQGRLVGVLHLPGQIDRPASDLADNIIIGEGPQVKDIMKYLSNHLPASHIPEVWASMSNMPQLRSCKVDRSRIRRQLETVPGDQLFPHQVNRSPGSSGSETTTEKTLRDLIGQVLRMDLSFAPSSSTFLQLGGNSLMAMQLVTRCKALGAAISLSQVLGNHNIEELARSMSVSRSMKAQPHPSNRVQALGRVPLTPAQRMFFCFYPWGPNYFNQSVLVRVNSARMSAGKLQRHLLTLVDHHPALRSRFFRRQDEVDHPWRWECDITDDVAGSFRLRTHVLKEGQEIESVARITAETQQALNISAGPVLTVAVFILPDGTLDMLLVAHHLIVDIVSWDILLSDLEVLLSGGSLSSSTSPAYPSFGSLIEEAENDIPDDSATRQEIFEFWGINNDNLVISGRKPARCPSKWTVNLTYSETQALSAAVRNIESLDVADVVEAALGSSLAEISLDSSRKSVPRMFVEEHGRSNEEATTVGWLTRFRSGSTSASPMPFVEALWQARHGRMNSQGRDHTMMIPSLPMELVLNYVGRPLFSQNESQQMGNVLSGSPHYQATERVPDTDPFLESLALIEAVASLSDQNLSITVTCDGRLENLDLVHALIDSSLRKLQIDAPAALISLETSQSLRPLPVLDSVHYSISQRRRTQVAQMLGLHNIDEVQEVLACTPTQERILLSQAREPRHYHLQAAWGVSTLDAGGMRIDPAKLQEACNKVVRHHASLRTAFVHLPDLASPVQIVQRNPPARKVLCARSVSNGQSEVVQVELDISHASFDGASTISLLRDIELAYRNKPLNKNNSRTLQKYVAYIEESDTKAADAFWDNHVAGAQICCLPQIGPAASKNDTTFGSLDWLLESSLQDDLGIWCRRFKASPATAIHVAWALTLRAYIGFDDVSFGWITTGRDAPVLGIEDAVGMFSSLLVCRATLASDDHLTDVVAAMLREVVQGLEHRLGSPKLHQHGHPLFDTLVSVQTAMSDAPENEGLAFHQLEGIDQTEFTLVLNAGIAREVLEFRLTYNSLKILDSVAEALFSAFKQALSSVLSMTSNAELRVNTINLCSRLHFLQAEEFNFQATLTSTGDFQTGIVHTIPSLLHRQVETRPDAVAVESWDARFTFAELDRVSAGLSRQLSRLGVTRGQIVPLLCEKSAAVVVTLVAILRMGACCTFLSPNDGIYRLKDIIKGQIGARVILASPDHAEKAQALGCDSLVIVDSTLLAEHDLAENDGIHCFLGQNEPEDVAFVVFTSGSTGKPKGVMLSHSSLCFSALNYGRRLGISEQSRIFQFSAYTFDVAIGDMVAALIHGATLCVPSEHDRINDLNGAIERFKSDWLIITPTMAAFLDPQRCTSLRSLAFVGEIPTHELYKRWHGRVTLFNAWGPAESAVLSSVHEIQSEYDLPNLIGRPVSCRMWLVNPSDPSRLVPTGAVGEILIEGPNVANGYLNDKERTKQVFISSDDAPSSLQSLLPNARLYLTGDLARYVPHNRGMMLFEGRKDSQIKLRGQRIELGEIESHFCHRVQEELRSLGICSHRVFGAVDTFKQRTGEIALAAFLHVLPASETEAGADNPAVVCELSHLLGLTMDDQTFYERVDRQLRQDLAAYMIPSVFLALSALPKSSSGKLDRKALRALAQTHGIEQSLSSNSVVETVKYTLLADPRQQHLRVLWSQVLEVDESAIGPGSNFFRLGGDSIAAIRLAAAIRQSDGLRLSVLTIMTFPELARMATQIHQDICDPASKTPSDSQTIVVDDNLSDDDQEIHFPATNVQADMVGFNMEPERGFMNYFILNLGPQTNKDKIKTACDALLAHYAVLRSCFEYQGPSMVQRILNNVDAIPIEHHRCTPAEDLDAAAIVIIKSDRAAPLAWGDCLTRIFFLLQDDTAAARVIFRLSHALYDGMCLPNLWRDFSRAYDGQSLGKEDTMFPQFANAAAIVPDDAVAFWGTLLRNSKITSLAREPRALSRVGCEKGLMHGRATRTISSTHFASSSWTPASVFKAAWAVALAGLSNSDDVVFGHVVSGREGLSPSMLDAFGAFLNIIPVRARLDPITMSPAQLVQSLHDQHIASLPHNTVGLRQLVDLGCVEWQVNAQFSSVVQYQNLLSNSIVAVDSGPLAGAEIHVEGSAGACVDLWLTATPNGASMNVDAIFDELVIPQQVADGLLEALCMVLRRMHAENGVSIVQLREETKHCLAQRFEMEK